jgi:hypothetical protein
VAGVGQQYYLARQAAGDVVKIVPFHAGAAQTVGVEVVWQEIKNL